MPEYLEICSDCRRTPLVTAVETDCSSGECVIALVEAGANHLITYSGETLLQIAERKNCSSGAVAYLRTLFPSRL